MSRLDEHPPFTLPTPEATEPEGPAEHTRNGHKTRKSTPTHDAGGTDVPRAPDAEKALLGHLLVDPTHADKLLPLVNTADFYEPRHELIWATATTLLEQGRTPDHLALLAHLTDTKALTRAGGPNYLLELRDHQGLVADPSTAADQISDTARIRHAMTALVRGQQALRTHGATGITQALEDAIDALDQAYQQPWAHLAPTTHTTGRVDLTWLLHGQPPATPLPTWVHRTDNTALFYDGVVNCIFGDPETAKTWLAQVAIVEALNTGHNAAMIDLDHNGPDHTTARLLRLGARPDHLANPDRFRYYEPEEPDELHAAVADLVAWKPAVVLFDSLGELLPLLGANSNSPDEVTTALRSTVTPVAKTGACVIVIDHLPKSHEARTTGYSIGSTAKKRMMRGAFLRAEAKQKPAPGSIGRITLRIEKDTLGGLRKTSGGGYVGTFVLDSTREDIQTTTYEITREHSPITDDGKFRPTSIMEQVSKFIEENDGCTQRDIEEAVTAKTTTIRSAIKQLLDEGFLSRIPGPRRSFFHHAVALYREAEDDSIQ